MEEKAMKPLLGVKPARIVITDRNLDLTKAIWERTMQEKITAADYRLMAIWTSEITLNCNMMLALDKTVKMMGE